MIYRTITNPSLHYMVWFALPNHPQLFLNLAMSNIMHTATKCELEIVIAIAIN